jgi:hypothetical protein
MFLLSRAGKLFRPASVAAATLSLLGSPVPAQSLLPNIKVPTVKLPRPLTDAWLDARKSVVREGADLFLEQRNRLRDGILADAGLSLQTATSLLNSGEFLADQVTGSLKIISGGLPAVKEVVYSRSRACFAKGPTACLQDIRNGSAAVSAAAACASGGGWSICQEAVRLGQLPPSSADRFANTIGQVMTEWEQQMPREAPITSSVYNPNFPPTSDARSPVESPVQAQRESYYPYVAMVAQTSSPVAIDQYTFGTTNNANGWNIYSLSTGRPLYFSAYIPYLRSYVFYYPDGLQFYP